jgi:hypothetical protein
MENRAETALAEVGLQAIQPWGERFRPIAKELHDQDGARVALKEIS